MGLLPRVAGQEGIMVLLSRVVGSVVSGEATHSATNHPSVLFQLLVLIRPTMIKKDETNLICAFCVSCYPEMTKEILSKYRKSRTYFKMKQTRDKKDKKGIYYKRHLDYSSPFVKEEKMIMVGNQSGSFSCVSSP